MSDENELRTGIEHVMKSLGAEQHSAGPTPTAVTRRISGPMPMSARTRVDRTPAAELPGEPHWHVPLEHGRVVALTIGGVERLGKLYDWNEQSGGVTVHVRHDDGDVHPIRTHARHLRPVGDREMDRLRREQAEREDTDQEQAAVHTMRFGADDLVHGQRVTCVGDDEEPVTGRIASVEPRGPHAHVTLRVHENGRSKLRAFEIHEVVQVHEEEES